MLMSKKYTLFSYKKGSSFLHKCPAWVKMLFLPLVNILFLCLPPVFSFVLIAVPFILACFLNFTIKEQLSDLLPVFFYAFFLFFMHFCMWLFGGVFSVEILKENLLLLVKILAVMQGASLLFKTSTSLELREGIGKLFGQKSALSYALFMFLNFIPMVGKIWEQSKKAWFARGGKHNIKMYLTLLPVLFSVGLKKAYNTARALSVRS